MKRAPSTPPDIPGFTYLQLLGSGGFADVFLYEQRMPRRRVAIKVLLPDRISTSAAQFQAEANVMAMLGAHPAIVAIYEAGVADDGRPYLVMEYCPRPNLQVRYRREPFSVEEALAIAVPVAAAVETAHRANVLHRDIKPANILVTEYNRPALTDFGIASSDAHPDEALGVSVPWSPPEAFGDPPRSDARSDVYQLGATVYTLLAGRAPFELAGGDNGTDATIDRIERAPLPDLGRSDVPAALSSVLARAMAKDPSGRHPTAIAFATALQEVQVELGYPVAPIDIFDDSSEAPHEVVDDVAGGTTRIRPFTEAATSVPRAEAPAPAVPFEIPDPAPIAERAAFAPDTGDGSAGSDPAVDDATQVRSAPVAPADDETVPRAAPMITPPAPSANDAAPEVPDAVFGHPVEFSRGTVPSVDASLFRTAAPAPAPPPSAATRKPPRRRTVIVWVAAAILVVAVGIVAAWLLTSLPAADEPTDSPGRDVDPITNLSGVAIGEEVTFTWTNPSEELGDVYLWGIYDDERVTALDSRADSTTVTIPPQPGDQTCIEVLIERDDGSRSLSEVACVDNAG